MVEFPNNYHSNGDTTTTTTTSSNGTVTPIAAAIVSSSSVEKNHHPLPNNNNNQLNFENLVKDQFKNHKDVDTMLAKDLNSLSLKERETVFEKIHGVDQHVQENEALIQASLKQFQHQLDLIQDKDAYNAAWKESAAKQEYLTSRKFRLYFLRSENFHVVKAARRMVVYMEKMKRYFGADVLGRPLYFSDLHEEAVTYLKRGCHQIVQQAKDSAGRAILLDHYQKAEKIKKSNIAMVQTYLYQFYNAIENDELVQTRGVVVIGYNIGKLTEKFDAEAYDGVPELSNWFPVKVPAIHVCFDSPAVSIFAPLAWIAMGPDLRQKVRIHNGTHWEIMYALQAFGIPVDAIPVTEKGVIKNTMLHKWIARRQAQEVAMKQRSSNPFEAVIESPAPADVVLWRGRIYQQHPGNLRMRALIDEFRQEYDQVKHGIRAQVAMRVVTIIKTTDGGRFITQDPSGSGVWIEVDDKEAQKKVSKSFRSSRANVPVAKKPTTSTTSNNNNKDPTTREKEDLTKIFRETGQYGNKRLRVVSPASDGCDFQANCCNFGAMCGTTPSPSPPPPLAPDFIW